MLSSRALSAGLQQLRRDLLCDTLNIHHGPLESYGHYSYINCQRCGMLRQPMPRHLAEFRFGPPAEADEMDR